MVWSDDGLPIIKKNATEKHLFLLGMILIGYLLIFELGIFRFKFNQAYNNVFSVGNIHLFIHKLYA